MAFHAKYARYSVGQSVQFHCLLSRFYRCFAFIISLGGRESAECNVEEAVDFDFHVEGKGTELALQEDLFSHRDLCSMMIGSGGGVGKCEKGARVARRASERVDE